MARSLLGRITDRFQHRGAMKDMRNQGYTSVTEQSGGVHRNAALERFDAYYENRQYDDLVDWDNDEDAYGEAIPLRQRKPRLQLAFAKTLSERLTAKLIGDAVFPAMIIPDAPEDQEFIKAVVRESKLKAELLEPVRRALNTGSIFIRFHIVAGTYKIQWYHAKYCYPVFQANGELDSIVVKYVYDDPEDKKADGSPKKKWYKLELGTLKETLYDNPEYQKNVEPVFTPVKEVVHEMGFVQGEWFRPRPKQNSVDGDGLVEDLMDFIDELCYSLSQSSQAVAYNQDPQLIFKKITEDEMGSIVRSVKKSWNIGQGEASFLESDLTGVKTAIDFRDKIRLNVQDISRVVLLDPEKIVGSAQSAKAMEVLHGPLKDLIDELRTPVGTFLTKLVLKIAMATLIANQQGIEVPVLLPPKWAPTSLAIELDWPPIFQQTMDDLQKKVQVAAAASSANLISRETALRFIAKDFGIENIEEEVAKVNAQPIINPFGGF